MYCKADSRKEDVKYLGFRDGVSEFNVGTHKMGRHYESKHWVYEIYYDMRRDIMFLGEHNGVLEVISCADFKQIFALELEQNIYQLRKVPEVDELIIVAGFNLYILIHNNKKKFHVSDESY